MYVVLGAVTFHERLEMDKNGGFFLPSFLGDRKDRMVKMGILNFGVWILIFRPFF